MTTRKELQIMVREIEYALCAPNVIEYLQSRRTQLLNELNRYTLQDKIASKINTYKQLIGNPGVRDMERINKLRDELIIWGVDINKLH